MPKFFNFAFNVSCLARIRARSFPTSFAMAESPEYPMSAITFSPGLNENFSHREKVCLYLKAPQGYGPLTQQIESALIDQITS